MSICLKSLKQQFALKCPNEVARDDYSKWSYIHILQPRVEVEEATPSTCELEQRLPMARTSSDVSDQYIIDESGVFSIQFVLHFLMHLH